MDGISSQVIEVVAATAAGLLVLLVEQWMDRRARAKGDGVGAQAASPVNLATASQAGDGASAIVQQGTGNSAMLDRSTHTTTNNYGVRGGSHAAGSSEDDFWPILIGGFLATAGLVAGFVLTQDILRVVFAVLVGGVIGGGFAALLFGLKARKPVPWHVMVALPWLIAGGSGTWLWGRWAGTWGRPLPRLADLERAVSTVKVDESQGWVARTLDFVLETGGVLVDHSQWLMPGVYSILLIVLHFAAVIFVGGFLWDALASARRPRLSSPSARLEKRADRFDDRTGAFSFGTLLLVLVCCGFGWALASGVFSQGEL